MRAFDIAVVLAIAALILGLVVVRRRTARARLAYAAQRNSMRLLFITMLTQATEDGPMWSAQELATLKSMRRVARSARGRTLLADVIAAAVQTVSEIPTAKLEDIAKRCRITQAIVSGLNSPAVHQRSEAAETIGELRLESMLAHLYAAMRDPAEEVRQAAAIAYVQLGPARAAPAVLRMLQHEPVRSQERLSEVVVLLGPAAAPALVEHIREHGRSPLLLRLLLGCGDVHTALPVLLGALDDPQVEVRRLAAVALGKAGTSMALPALLSACHDDHPEVRSAVITALGQIGRPSTMATIVACLNDPEWSVRQYAAAALAAMPGGVDLLLQVSRGAPPFVVSAAAVALQRTMLGTGMLAELIGPDPRQRLAVERALDILVTDAGFTTLIGDLARRYPNAGVRTRLAELYPHLTVDPVLATAAPDPPAHLPAPTPTP